VWRKLSQKFKRDSSILIVRHEPYLSNLIKDTISDENRLGTPIGRVVLKKAGLIWSNEDSPSSRILSIPPESEAEPEEPESSIGDFRVSDPEMQVDKPDTNYVNSISRYVNSQTPTIKEARKIAEAVSKNQEYASRIDDLRDPGEEGEEPVVMESSNSDAVDWDLDEAWRTRFLKTIIEERRQRSEELALIEHEKRALDEQRYSIEEYTKQIEQSKHNLDSASYNLEIREQKLLEVEPFLAMARQLRDMSLGFEELIPWVASIQEKSTLEKIDLKSAAHGIAQSLRAYRNLETLQKAIRQANQQLVVLNTFTAQKERAVISLMNLENAGVRESEVIDLINIARWSTQYDAGTGQGNGSGKSHNNSAGDHNGSKAFKLDDKLNL
jgi:hypothetical protein